MAKNTQKTRKPQEPGYDGAKIVRSSVRVTASRTETRSIRAMPGTFEWRYARAKPSGKDVNAALYHAGSHYARLWERAGTADVGSPNFDSAGGGVRLGLADRRCESMDELKLAFQALGMWVTSRLTDYCVKGMTTAQIARRHGSSERDMASVLQQDLRDCARHFKFL
jgi:hypothetical protein